MWGDWVHAFALEEVHAVEAEGADPDQGLGGGGGWARGLGDVQGGGGAFAAFDGLRGGLVEMDVGGGGRGSRTDCAHGGHCAGWEW